MTLSAEKYSHLEDYTTMFCSFAIGQLYEVEHGKFKTKKSANKTLSAFKYCFRGYSVKDQSRKQPRSSFTRGRSEEAMVLDKNCERFSYTMGFLVLMIC